MRYLPTPHILAKINDIAETVIMPGDPLRAKYIAENFLENTVCFNKVRGMLGFTGDYKNKKVSVMGSGMGMPSMGIYSYEIFNFTNAQNIIRIGSAGAINDKLNLLDIILAQGACTDSNFATQFNLRGTFAPLASFKLLKKAEENVKKLKIKTEVGNVLSSDYFYDDNTNSLSNWRKMGVLAVEMEAAALYMNAARCNKNALCILTVSDKISTGEQVSSEERETGFNEMIKLALETAIAQGES